MVFTEIKVDRVTFVPFPTPNKNSILSGVPESSKVPGWELRELGVWMMIQHVNSQLHLHKREPGRALTAGDVIPAYKNTPFGAMPVQDGDRTKLTEDDINLYLLHAPRLPTPQEALNVRACLNTEPRYDRAITKFLGYKSGQDFIHASCDIYFRHIRAKRRAALGSEYALAPGLPPNKGKFGQQFSPLFDLDEYGHVPGRAKPDTPLIPPGAPVINGMQSLISLETSPEDHPITRNTGPNVFSKKPLSDLKPILVKDMKADAQQQGRYLICRTTSLPVCIAAAAFVPAADPEGGHIRLAIHNAPIQPISLGFPTVEEYKAMLPKDSILLIKEPYLDHSLEHPQIVVQSPTDLQVLSLTDPLLTHVKWRLEQSTFKRDIVDPCVNKATLEEWKAEAIERFDKKLFYQAERSCSRGIEQHPDHTDIVSMYMLRAELHLKLERWYQAEADAEKTVAIVQELTTEGIGKKRKKVLGGLMQKAMLLSGMACYGRRDWKAAREAFQKASEKYNGSEPVLAGLRMAEARIKEVETGSYDWFGLYEASARNSHSNEIGDYVGPMEEKEFPGKGKGVVASRDLKAGELIAACKAMGVWGDEMATYNLPAEQQTFMRLAGSPPAGMANRLSLAYKAYWQPELHRQIKALYSGIEDPDRPRYPFKDETDYRGVAPEPIDMRAIESVGAFNLFGLQPLFDPWEKMERNGSKGFSSGLFPSLSLFNNSCKPNLNLQSMNNVMSVRVNEDVPAGAELCVAYNPGSCYPTRCTKLELLMGVPCVCSLCQDDQKDGMEAHLARQQFYKTREDQSKRNHRPPTSASRARKLEWATRRQKQLNDGIAQVIKTYGDHRDAYWPELRDAFGEFAGMQKDLHDISRNPDVWKGIRETLIINLRSYGVELASDPEPKGRKRIVKALEGLPIRTLPCFRPARAILYMVRIGHMSDDEAQAQWAKATEAVFKMTVAPDMSIFKDKAKDMGIS